MSEISCFYNHQDIEPIIFIFIKYDKYFKILLNNRSIILTYQQLIYNNNLFQIYILSLLCTADTSFFDTHIIDNDFSKTNEKFINIYDTIITASYIQKNYKDLYFTNRINYNYKKTKLINGIYTQKYWKNQYFTTYYDFIVINNINCIEPKHSSSSKKIRKFIKLVNHSIKNPILLINQFIKFESDYIISYFKTIENI